jgi:DNA repair exonuclease SbcCD ATPase subunit
VGVKLLDVDIENFMGIGAAKLKLADRGLVLIQGENEDETSSDSNGAGKSSIFDAISWCIYGATARGESGDAIINRTAGKECRVMVTVEDGADVYRIARHRKHKKHKNALTVLKLDPSGTITDLSKGTEKLTQVVAEQIVGCSYDVFCGAVYAGQEKMPDLPGKTDKELKMLIEEASGATLLEAAYQEANRKLREAQIGVMNATNLLTIADQEVIRLTDGIEGAKIRQKDFDEGKVAAVKALHAEGQLKKKTIEELETVRAGRDKLGVQVRIEALDKQIAAVAGEIAEERTLSNSLQIATRKLDAARIAYDTAEKALEKSIHAIEALDHQVGCPCSTCDRPYLAEDIAPAKKIAETRKDEAKAAQLDAFKALDAATKAHKSTLEKRDAFRASMTDLTKTNAARASLQEALREITTLEHGIKGHKSDLAALVARMKAKRDEVNPFIDMMGDLIERLTEQNLQAGVARDELKKAAEAQEVAELVAKVFSPAGVRAFLLDEVTPFLNDQTAKYLGTLSDGNITATWTTLVKTAKGDLREKFSIEVDKANGGGTFGLISGGEKRKVRIACALALQDLVARRATKPIELFIGDEIDDALDDAGRQRLMDILQEKAKERGSVFIISHSDLKDWIRNHVTVRRVAGKSSIEEATV